jgi:hypothetical protein
VVGLVLFAMLSALKIQIDLKTFSRLTAHGWLVSVKMNEKKRRQVGRTRPTHKRKKSATLSAMNLSVNCLPNANTKSHLSRDVPTSDRLRRRVCSENSIFTLRGLHNRGDA